MTDQTMVNPDRTPSPSGRLEFARRARAGCGWIAALAAILLVAGCATPQSPAPRAAALALPVGQLARAEHNLRVFDSVWDLIERKFYDPKLLGVDWPAAARRFGPQAAAATDDPALYDAIDAMLRLLPSSHTVALTPRQAEERSRQELVRTGMDLLQVAGGWAVESVVPGSPAAAAGVEPGWVVLRRNGKAYDESTNFLPKPGDMIHWDFLDGLDRPVTLELAARVIPAKPREEIRHLAGGVVYLRFDEFDADSRDWLHARMREQRDAPALVIDLRRNSGGGVFWMREAIGDFLEARASIGTFVGRDGDDDDVKTWQFGSVHYRGRVAVLVSDGSASAAEIFAAVLQSRHRATIVGQKTAGKVLVSRFYGLPDGGELQVGIEDYLAPGGRRLENNGVQPDVPVPGPTLEDLRTQRDQGLAAAVRLLAEPDRR
jgi:C-terminal peptidase prc